MTTTTPRAPHRVAAFGVVADLLGRVVKMLGRTLTAEEVSEAIDAAFAERPSPADMSALVAAFSTPPREQPRDHQGRYASHQPHAATVLTPERRRQMLSGTAEGRAILDREDKAARPQGRQPAAQPSAMDPERRRALLAATDLGRAVLVEQQKHARDQQRDYPGVDRMTDAARRQHLATYAPDALIGEDDAAKRAPWQTPRGMPVHNLTPAAYRHTMELTDVGRGILREEDKLAREKGIPFARPLGPIHEELRAPVVGQRAG